MKFYQPRPECEPVKLLLADGLRGKCHEGAHDPGEEEGEETEVEIMEPVHCRLHKLRPDSVCHLI